MGLEFSHSDVYWSYSQFHDFRKRLAREIGIELEEMQGFELDEMQRELMHLGYMESRIDLGEGEEGLSWDGVVDDLLPFLRHSDCDGTLSPEECRRVGPRLRELVGKWPDGHIDKRRALKLADAMDECSRIGEHLEFM